MMGKAPLWRRYARFTGPRLHEDVDEELRFHLERRAEEYVAKGMDPARAREEAERRFGDVGRVRRDCTELGRASERTRRRREMFGSLRQDLGFGLRTLRRSPGFTVVAILTIALGIGASTAVFSVLNGVLLRPLPLPAADRLVVPQSQRIETGETWGITYGDYAEWKDLDIFGNVAVLRRQNRVITGDGEAERLSAIQVSDDFFATIGVAPVLGRHFRPDEFVPGARNVAVISYGLWQRRFGGDRAIVGREVRIRGEPVEIVGVLPIDMGFPSDADIWIPIRLTAQDRSDVERRDNYIFTAIARLAPGKSLETTRAELASYARRVESDHPQERSGVTLTAAPLLDQMVGARVSRALWLVLGAVGFVLLIGCVNVANLLMSRASARQRELAIRSSLGAGRGRLVRQLLTESLLLSLLGGALGVLMALIGIQLLVASAPPGIPRLEEVALDGNVLAFGLLVTVLCALLFGIAPAVRSTGRGESAALREESLRTTRGKVGRRMRDLVVAGELALSLVLLGGAGLLLRSLENLRNTDPGFRTENLLTFNTSLQGDRYDPDGAAGAAFETLLSRIETLPGVRSAVLISGLPLGGGGFYLGRSFLAEGQPEPPAGEDVQAMWTVATPGVFETLGTPLLQGRDFTEQDGADSPPVMIVTREFARRISPDGDVLGKRVRSWRDENVYREIVGVVGDIRSMGLEEEGRPLVFVPHAQDEWSSMVVAIQTRIPPLEIVPAVRGVLREFDPELAIARVQSMDDVLSAAVAPRRFGALLISAFALLALTLAAVGIYGVLSYAVSQRTREIGVRMALGATKKRVLRMVIGEAGRVVALGVTLGLVATMAIGRLVNPLLHHVEGTDPSTHLAVALLLSAVALAASLIPAWRATRVEPMTAIRTE